MLSKLSNLESCLSNLFVRCLGQECTRMGIEMKEEKEVSLHRNLQSLKVVRNLMFEYELHVKKFLKPQFMLIQSLMSIILR